MISSSKWWIGAFFVLGLVACSDTVTDPYQNPTENLCAEPFRAEYEALDTSVTQFKNREAAGPGGTYFEKLERYNEAKVLQTEARTVMDHSFSLYSYCKVTANSKAINPYGATYDIYYYLTEYIADFDRRY